MKSMEELVLDRLIEESTRPMRTELEAIRKELETTKTTLRYREDGLAREVAARQKLHNDALSADGPITELYKAAEAYLRARSGRPTKEQNLTGRRLNQALTAAEPHVDLIPF